MLFQDDCLTVLPTLATHSVDMILADLPYGTTANKWDSVIPLDILWQQYKRIIKPEGAIVLMAQQPFSTVLAASNLSQLRYEWVWEKNRTTGFLNAKKAPLKAHEVALVFYGRSPTYNPQMTTGTPYKVLSGRQSSNYGQLDRTLNDNSGTRYPKTVLRFDCERGLHPTQKPVALMEYLIRTYTNAGETVLDNTMGVGTTGVACVRADRAFIGIERDAGYFAVARDRIMAEKAALPASGQSL